MKAKLFSVILFVACALFVGCEKDYEPGKNSQNSSPETNPEATITKERQEGALPGAFFVSETKCVAFSQGYLCYQESTKKWRFATEQWAICRSANDRNDKSAWIDLFQWGNLTPYVNTYDENFQNLGATTDWGQACKIENGGNKEGLWRTLTAEEWDYLLKNNETYTTDISLSSYNSRRCKIIIPKELSISPKNSYTISEWKDLEEKGVVLLPDHDSYYYDNDYNEWTRRSNSTFIYDVWTASYFDDTYAYQSGDGSYVITYKCECCPVRLVCDLN